MKFQYARRQDSGQSSQFANPRVMSSSSGDAAAQTSQPVGTLDRQARFKIWKDQHVPLLYDWLSSRSLIWPHAAVQWGALATDEPSRRDRSSSMFSTRALYLAERTGSARSDPNTLLHFDVRIVHPLVNKPAEVARPWYDDSGLNGQGSQVSSRDFWLRKRIIHPGEVNKIKHLGGNKVITHTDSKYLYVWDLDKQQDRKGNSDLSPNVPECTLEGHSMSADYALDVAASKPNSNEMSDISPKEDIWVVSGGSDCAVLVWRLEDADHLSRNVQPFARMNGSRGMANAHGHKATVEDVSFNRLDRSIVASVGRDAAMLIWDVRTPIRPVSIVPGAHDGDINCCDFGGENGVHIATGGSDSLVRVWDRRYLKDAHDHKKPLHSLRGHSNEVTSLMWNRHQSTILASGGEDGEVLMWNLCEEELPLGRSESYRDSPQLMFRHAGHSLMESKVVDLEWMPNEKDPFCIASLSETVGTGGSTVQIWRMSDMIYRKKEAVMSDLRRFAESRRP